MIDILELVTEIVQNISQLMKIDFIANHKEADARIAMAQLGEQVKFDPSVDFNPEYAKRESCVLAQKSFLLLCDLVVISPKNDSEAQIIRKLSVTYLRLLLETVISIPFYSKIQTTPPLTNSYYRAISQAETNEWNDVKNNLIVCWSQLFQGSQAINPNIDSNASEHITYTIDSSEWSVSTTEPNSFNESVIPIITL